MNLIDHRILIPTSPERVWHFVGDLKRNTEWQANCRSVSMLTSTPKPQAGTRLRITPERGREYVIEITAWYDRFGYEYIVVEGAKFRDNKGTVRLQEVPEGTIVQWTFSYKPGLFGGSARTQESAIIDSLRSLYKLITKSKEVETFQAKSLMREDPGAEARASYRPRHPYGDTAEGSAVHSKPPQRPTSAPPPPLSILTEPPIKQGDTKPRPLVTDTPAAGSPPAVVIPPVPYDSNNLVVEPDFLIDDDVPFADVPSERIMPVITPSAPQPIPAPEYLAPPIAPVPLSTEPAAIETPKPVEISAPAEPVVSASPTPVETQERPQVKDDTPPQPVKQDTAPVAIAYPTPAEVMPAVKPPVKSPDKLMDTSRISVFEIFGLPKPSETQEIKPLQVDEQGNPIAVASTTTAAETTQEALEPAPEPVVIDAPLLDVQPTVSAARQLGYRALARRKLANLRRPY